MIERVVATNGVVTYRSSLLAAAGVPHAFTTRVGGTSPAPNDTLHLGLVRDEPAERQPAIEENFVRLWSAVGFGARERFEVRQVHADGILHAREGRAAQDEDEADAILSDRIDLALVVRTADCVPILLASADGRVVAAIHAGWRGIVAGVVPVAVRAIGREYDIVAGDLRVAIGPAISVDSYEVGDEVAQAFGARGLGAFVRRETPDAKPCADLRGSAAHQLALCGVAAAAIDVSDRCTFRDRDEFFSHRRDAGRTGRMAAVIGAGC